MLNPVRVAQQGFVLLEALIAMLVFALGILGLVGTQVAMTREQANAKLRADAAYLAGDLIGTMWGDVTNISSYRSSSCKSYARCNDWLNKVVATLPSASTTVAVDSSTNLVSIAVMWTMPNGDSHQFLTATTIKAIEAN